MKRNRWLIALAAAGIHICIGSVYAWSVLTKPVMAEMGLSLSETTWAFSIAILFLGLSAGFLGGIVERLGPRKSGLVSACFFASAMVGTAFAVYVKSAVLLYLFYGCIGGDRTGNRVYHSGIHAGEVVSFASRLCYGSGHYGIWICRSYCGPCYAVPYCDGGAGGEFPYSCRGLCGGDGAFCILPSGAPSGRGGSLSSRCIEGGNGERKEAYRPRPAAYA